MNRVRQIIEEIRELEKEQTHRSSMRIYTLLENNRKLFLEKIDADDFKYLLSAFKSLTEKTPAEYGSSAYRNEFQKNFQLLAFHLGRVI